MSEEKSDPILIAEAERRDAIKLLRQLLEPCEGPDDHSWRKCRRCIAIHGIEMRFPLSMRLLEATLFALQAVEQRVREKKEDETDDTRVDSQ